jgi:NADPH:quinone reductase-like Zn-dependent oxidoreductase
MQVAEVSAFGAPEALHLAERPDPAPAPGEAVVRIRAANINPTDMATRAGVHSPPGLELPYVPGWDLAGEVTAIGGEVDGFAPGDRVVGMIPFGRIGGRVGSYAQAAAVDPAWLAPLPGDLEDALAATLPLNALTARQALDLIGAAPGSTLLVTGASGAVGGFATQLAARDGVRVIAQASHDDEDWVASLGAAEVLPRSADLARIDPVDAVLDAVPLGPSSTARVRDGGTAVFTRPPGADAPPGLRFETVRVMPDPAALAALARDLAAGELRTRVAHVLPLAEAGRGHALAEAGGLRGKVVLAPWLDGQ